MLISNIRRFLSNPLISIAILVLFSVLILAVDSLGYAILNLLPTTMFAILIGVKPKKLLTSLAYATLALLFYTAVASVIQVILLSYIDVHILFLNIVRIEALIAMSIAIAESIDIMKLISLSRRISVRLALAIALSLKMIRDFTGIWGTVKDTYSINLGVRSFRKKILAYMLMVKVFLILSLYSAIQTAEAIITRPRLYINQEDFSEETTKL